MPTNWNAVGPGGEPASRALLRPDLGGRSVRLLTVVRAGEFARHRYSQRRRPTGRAVAMLVRRNGRGPQRNRRLIAWPRLVQAWREDHEQHAVARAEARAHAPLRRGE